MKLTCIAFCFFVFHSGIAFAQVKPEEQVAFIAQALTEPPSVLALKKSLLSLNQFDSLPLDLLTLLARLLTYSNPDTSFSEAEEIRTLARAILMEKRFCSQTWSSPPQH